MFGAVPNFGADGASRTARERDRLRARRAADAQTRPGERPRELADVVELSPVSPVTPTGSTESVQQGTSEAGVEDHQQHSGPPASPADRPPLDLSA